MIKEKDLTKALNDIFGSLIASKNEEVTGKYGAIINELSKNEKIKNPKYFDLFINWELSHVIEALVYKLHPEVPVEKINKLFLLYKHYQMLDCNLEKIIKSKEPFGCCSDKSGWILKCYQEYILNNTIPNMYVDENIFWKPRFGTGKQWIDFCEGIVDLCYGHNQKYLNSLRELLSTNEEEE